MIYSFTNLISLILCLSWSNGISIRQSRSLDINNECTVSANNSNYVGYQATTYDNQVSYCSFLGIKYAVAERYKEAVTYESPSKDVETVKDGPECLQLRGNYTFGSEDCLYLSIHSPDLKGSLPVLVYIHGGGFAIGTSKLSYQKPDFFMQTKKVVMVFIQYRLGALGFVDFNSNKFPSNLGLKDQVLALKWVKQNIAAFGGNPNKVTIQGESAGGASVSLHLFSPLSKGLFRAGISESGTACASWSVLPKAWARNRLKKLAALVGCSVKDLPDLLVEPADLTAQCLKEKSAEELVKASGTFSLFNGMNSFLPVTEKASSTNPFLTFIPWSTPNDQVPWISGINSNEAGTLLKVLASMEKNGNEYNVSLSKALYYDYTTLHPEAVTMEIEEHYGFQIPAAMQQVPGVTKAIDDGTFGYPNYLCHNIHSGSYSYNYYFNYVASALRNRPVKGVFHTEELQYLFIRHDSNIRVSGNTQDIDVSNKMVDLWVSFVETSTPSTTDVKWDHYNSSTNQVLVIDDSGFSMSQDPNLQDYIFWSILPFRELMP